jgi:acyl carrier protein
MTGQAEELREWSRDEVMAALRTILVESLGVKDEEVVASASVVRNLGAESIDFLDVSFQIQQTFGVNIQAAEIRDRIIAWGALILPTLVEILEGRYGVKLSGDTLRPLEASGIEGVLAHVHSACGISIEPGAADAVGRELLRRLIKEFTAFGFVVSEADERDLLAIMRADLGTRRITERTMDLLTVGSLANFICVKLGPRLHAA